MGPFRLFTTMLDPTEVSASDLATTYAQRWEIESAFDELKTHQRGPKMVLRSKSPALVEQEIWGHLCCHYAIRTLMFEAAHDANVDPDRVSFTAALRISQRSLAQARDSPLRALITAGHAPSSCGANGSTRHAASDRTHGSSSARCPSARQTRPPHPLATTHRPTHPGHPRDPTERYWG